jgi:FkbM family methyltransferase
LAATEDHVDSSATISDEYLKQQRELHQNPHYGEASLAYAPLVRELLQRASLMSLADYGAGKQNLKKRLDALGAPPFDYRPYDPAFPDYGPPREADLVCCIDVLEHIEPDRLAAVFADLQRITTKLGFFTIHTGAAFKVLSDGRNAHLIQQPASWWLPQLCERFEVRHVQSLPQGFWVIVEPRGRSESAIDAAAFAQLSSVPVQPPAAPVPAPARSQPARLLSYARRLARRSSRPVDPLALVLEKAIQHNAISPDALLKLKARLGWTQKMDYSRHDIFLHIDSPIEYHLRLRSCAKEADTVEWVEGFMNDGDVFYDVGANVGPYSLVAAKYHAGKVKVFAFEPAFLNFAQLCRNIHLNQCQRVITPLSVALADETSLGEFNYQGLLSGGALHTFGAPIDQSGAPFDPALIQPMLGYRLDDLIAQFRLPAPNHLKIDVDGIEFAVLRGAERTLASGTVKSLVVELEEGRNEQAISDWLLAAGFRLHAKYNRWTPRFVNCIFVRAS